MPVEIYKRKPLSRETKRKISLAHRKESAWSKGKHLSKEHKKELSIARIGIVYSNETKRKMSIAQVGNKNSLGHHFNHTKKTKKQISKALKGSKSYRWKGGITPEAQKRCNDMKWKELREEIYQRDNYICQDCGVKCNKEIGFNAHHIIPYILTKDNNSNNLQTLCDKCHAIADYQFQFVL